MTGGVVGGGAMTGGGVMTGGVVGGGVMTGGVVGRGGVTGGVIGGWQLLIALARNVPLNFPVLSYTDLISTYMYTLFSCNNPGPYLEGGQGGHAVIQGSAQEF